MIPAKIVAAKRYSTPYSATKFANTNATDPAAAEISPVRPPKNAAVAVMKNVA